MEELSPERRRQFFVEEEGGYRVGKALRERCIFARHNLFSDPPFSRLDLISCRNSLIYIEGHSQQEILPAFHYALKPHGFLFLGASESLGAAGELFEAANKKAKIFCRKPGVTPRLALPVSRSRPGRGKPNTPGGTALEGQAGELNALREADRVVANRFAPPVVLVDSDLRIVQSRGETGEDPGARGRQGELRCAQDGAGGFDAAVEGGAHQSAEAGQSGAHGECKPESWRGRAEGEPGGDPAQESEGALLLDLF